MTQDDDKDNYKRAFQTIQHWNEQLVQARKQGNHQRVAQLKQNIEDFLQQQLQKFAISTRSSKSHPTEETPAISHRQDKDSTASPFSQQTESATPGHPEPHPARSLQHALQQLQTLNLQIVAARKRGDDAQVRALQEQATQLMEQARLKF